MKNVRENQLKKCIFMELDKFRQDVKEFFGDDTEIIYDYKGLYFESGNEDAIYTEEVLAGLSKYYDVEVTSVHTDTCEYVGVWICYKEKEHPHPRYTDNEVTIIVKDGLVQEVYGTDKTMDARVIDLDQTDAEMLEQLEDEANCIRAEWYDIWK